MTKNDEDYGLLVKRGEESQLKIDLNKGVASLLKAGESCLRPHVCLNERGGVEVIGRIARDPENANTSFRIAERVNYGGHDGIWLNINFFVILEEELKDKKTLFNETSSVSLSPRQSGYIAKNLPFDSGRLVKDKVRAWYFKKFLKELERGIGEITKQFNEDDLFVADVDDNKVFDIHKDGEMERLGHSGIPYTEWDIIGNTLFCKIFFGRTPPPHEQGYEQIDEMLMAMDRDTKMAADAMLSLVRMFR